MATPELDLSLLKVATPLFTLILVTAITYAFASWGKLFGENKFVHVIISFIIGIFVTVVSDSARKIIEYIIPWFTVIFIFLVFLLILFKVFGATDESIRNVITKHTGTQYTLIIIGIVILLGALANTFGQQMLETTAGKAKAANSSIMEKYDSMKGTGNTATQDIETNITATFYHPKILGMLFVLIIGAIAIRSMASPNTPSWPD